MNEPLLVVALDEPPYLMIGEPVEGFMALAADQIAGTPRLPAAGEQGYLAYNFLTAADRPVDWLTGTAVLDQDGVLVDIVPDTLLHVRPTWTTEGSLITARRHGTGTLLVVTEMARPEEHHIALDVELRSVHCNGERTCVLTSIDGLMEYDRGTGAVRTLWRDDVAAQLKEFGTDDMYVTLDDVWSAGPSEIFFNRTWHQAGKSAEARLVVWRGESDVDVVADDDTRSFRMWKGWRGFVRHSAVQLTRQGDSRSMSMPAAHSIDFVRSDTTYGV